MRVFCETRRMSMINPNNIHTQTGSGCQCQYCRTAKLHALCHTIPCSIKANRSKAKTLCKPRPTYLLAAYLTDSRTVFSLVRPLRRPSAVLVVLDLLRDLAVICGTSLLHAAAATVTTAAGEGVGRQSSVCGRTAMGRM